MSDTSHYSFDEFTSHGLLQAELRVLDHLPPSLAQGIFSKAACYPAVVRLSSAPLLRGMAVKVTVPDGGRMAEQDFVMGGAPDRRLLGETYFSQARIHYGDHVAQLCAVSASRGQAPRRLPGPQGLRDAFIEHFARHGAEWELRVCLEYGGFGWLEDASHYVPVARIIARPQPAWSSMLARAAEGAVTFSPWQCVDEHRPMGAIVRAQRDGYGASARFRSGYGAGNMSEPYNTAAPSAPN
ncbi:hypothetical protein GCM10027277_50820 [Pseudoduganella ginsengisoli]|uniref:Uncharacterized protein n=1 Tax=Pseudoduganella ginsengisoli TaxID=1462440 RepID=A0A6L6Q8A6_9BURK|nr:hypothetical protein [Pseudoduganella ginsengisoli]MTW06017.1 hypothetical protein [Pseudoduganella ginsengisoli]